jgi:glutamate formiminotransferase/formiminotetrahydrofolate cyclodeaminase
VTRFESVPNFSEGRDSRRIEQIVAPARSVPGVTVLDVERNPDHHRSVVSLVGEGAPLVEAVFRMMTKAVELIDLRLHKGEHPRMGAVDVVPFVPLGDAPMSEAVRLAETLAERVWSELRVPVYLYAAAARRPERADLAVVRQGEFEGLGRVIATDPARRPDIGEPALHPSAGAVAIGARPVLIAYNAYLTTPDVAIAKRIAKAVRARDGGLVEVKALGFEIAERSRAQVSMNLTDYRRTPVHRALEAVRREAARYGVGVEESEVVGLIPEDALFDAAEFYLQLNRFERGQILERKLRSLASASGAEIPPAVGPEDVALSALPLPAFTARLAARTSTPGGGSASALAGALGAALGEMVLAFSAPARAALSPALATAHRELGEACTAFLSYIDEDSRAYEAMRAARRERTARPDDPAAASAYIRSLQRAAEVPLESARLARRCATVLESVRGETKAALGSDLVTALALLRAAAEGALANVAINLDELRAAGLPVADVAAEMDRLSAHP